MSPRIRLSQSDLNKIRPGLECLVNRLASAHAGHYPNRNPWDRVDPQTSDIYRDRAFSGPHAAMILRLRNLLHDFTSGARIRLDVFELAAISFAARISHMDSELNAGSTLYERLTKKIETYRKRAKRAVIGRAGHAHYEERAAEWQKFVRWMRYNLLSRNTRRPGFGALRLIWKEQYERLFLIAGTAIAERQHVVKSQEGLQRVVRLALPELRRRRHPLTIRELCANEEEGKTFLFEFALAREAIRPISATEALCLLQSEIEGNVQMAPKNSSPHTGIAPVFTDGGYLSKPEGVWDHDPLFTSPEGIPRPVAVANDVSRGKPEGPSAISSGACAFTNEHIADAVAKWFKTEINRNLWEEVCTEAQLQVVNFSMRHTEPMSFRTLAGLIAKTRVQVNKDERFEMTNNIVDWLLGFLLQLRRYPLLIQEIIGIGYARAIKGQGLSEARYS